MYAYQYKSNMITINGGCVRTKSQQSNCQVAHIQSMNLLPMMIKLSTIEQKLSNLSNVPIKQHSKNAQSKANINNQDRVCDGVIDSRIQTAATIPPPNHISCNIGTVTTHNLWLCGEWTSARQPLLTCGSRNNGSIIQDESKFCDWDYSEYVPIYPRQCPQLSVIEPYSFENIAIISNGANNFNPLSVYAHIVQVCLVYPPYSQVARTI